MLALGTWGLSVCAVGGSNLHTACIALFLVTKSMCPCLTATIAKMTVIRPQVMETRPLMPGRNIVPEISLDRYVWPEQPLAHNTPPQGGKRHHFLRRMPCARHCLCCHLAGNKKSNSFHSRPCIGTSF